MKRRKLPLIENVLITDVGAEGKAIARINDIVTFVPMVAPGDLVDLQITRKRTKFMEARAVKFRKLSETRVAPLCQHFGTCGGCKWQHLPYSEQIRHKEKQVRDAINRIGKADVEVLPILASENDYFYRNKLEFAFSNRRWISTEEIESGEIINDRNGIGFHIPGQFDKVVNIEKCWLQPDPSNAIRDSVRKFAENNNLSFFNPKEHGGFLRNLIIRTTLLGDVMVIVSFYHEDEKPAEALLTHLRDSFPGITSLMYTINIKGNDTLYDQEIKVFSGNDHIIEELEGLRFKIGPKSFFQTNTKQALELYRTVRKFAEINPGEVVYDLYTGTGSIANFIAANAKKVIGIESIPEAISDAKVNSQINNIKNTEFFSGDIKDVMNESFISEHGRPDVLITDPPRAGMHPEVIDSILKAMPGRIVYVSCNPATQARDLLLLSEKYEAVVSQPVDMFPHTHHVENVLLMRRRM